MDATFALRSEGQDIPATNLLLAAGTSILGRSSKCELIVKHDTISRRHAEITVTKDNVTVCDLGGRNGTFIDNKRIQKTTMRVGQHARFGSVLFQLALVSAGKPDSDSEIETAKCLLAGAGLDLAFADLSKAEHRVLALLLEGLGEKQVAARLKVSSTTVHNHVQAIYRIFKVHSRPELLVRLLTTNAPLHGMLS